VDSGQPSPFRLFDRLLRGRRARRLVEPPHPRGFEFETLEPRVLMSADLLPIRALVAAASEAPPIAAPAAASVVEGGSVSIDVVAGDLLAGDAAVTLTAIGPVQHGSAAISGGLIAYVAADGYVGPDDFTYTISEQAGADQSGSTAVGLVSVTATAAPPPTAGAVSAQATPGAATIIDALAADTGTGLTLASVTQPADGGAAIADGKIVYTSAAGFTGTDAFSYTVADVNGQTATGAVMVTVAAALAPPVANPAQVTATEGRPTTIDVLANDTGSGLALASLTQPADGAAAIAGGKIVYTPAAGYIGLDQFSYTITGADGQSATAAVEVAVQAGAVSSPPPVANPATATAQQGAATDINVLANDTGDDIALASVTAPSHGAATIAGGEIVYTSDPTYAGADAFSYTIDDANGGAASAAVNVTVQAAVIPPAPAGHLATVGENGSIVIDVLATDAGTGLTLTNVGTPTQGTAAVVGGKIVYTANPDYIGTDSFTYNEQGASGATAIGFVLVNVIPAGSPPQTNPVTAVADSGAATLIDALASDSGQGLLLTSVSTPAHGAASLANGKISYTSEAGYTGPDSFTYTLKDGNGLTATGGVSVTVQQPVPVAEDVTATVTENGSVLVDVLAGDTGDGLTLTGASAPADGTAVISGGKILYAPTQGYVGLDTFTYTVTDASGVTATANVDVAVQAGSTSGGAPLTAEPLAASVAPGGTVTLDAVAADSGEGLTVTSVGAPADGTATIANGLISYTAGPSYVGTASFAYTVTDVNGAAASSTVTITIGSAAGDQPTVFSPTLTAAEGAGPTPIGIAAPTDPVSPAADLTVTLTALPTDGTVTTADGAPVASGQTLSVPQLEGLLFTPGLHVFGQLSALDYSVADAAGNAASGSAALVVGPAEGAPILAQPGVRPSFATTPYAGAEPLGAAAPQDPNFSAGQLAIAVTSLPTNGAVTLADGAALSGPGQVLTIAELQGLLFTPDPAAAGESSAFTYGVSDPAGNASVGSVIIMVGPQTAAAAPTVGFVSPATGAPVSLAITDAAASARFAGSSGKDVLVTLSGGVGSTAASVDGSWTIQAAAFDPSAAGERMSVTATASWPGLAASAPSAAAQLLVLPAPDAAGTIETDLSSQDVADLLHAGYSLQFSPDVEAVQLVDGVLSVGPDTDEAFIQRLYVGLLGRSYDPAGMESWALAMAQGESETQVAAGFLASAEYISLPHAAGSAAFVQSLYGGFLGRAPDAAGLAYWTSAPAQAQGPAAIVASFDDSAESKARNAFATAKVFARSETGTVLHDIYESALGREADPGGLAFYTRLAQSQPLAVVADDIAHSAEAQADHAGQTDGQFVTQLYEQGLGRVPDAADLASFVARLGSGLTRSEFILGLASAPEAVAHLTSDDFSQPPSLAQVADITLHEGQTAAVQLEAASPDRTALAWSLVGGPPGASVSAAGLFTWTAPDVAGDAAATVLASGPTGLFAVQRFSLDTVATPPALSASASAPATAATQTRAALSSVASSAGTAIASWVVDWGDGGPPQAVAGADAAPAHVYAAPGVYQVRATAVTAGDGSFEAPAVPVSVSPGTLQATGLVAEAAGFRVRFDAALDFSTVRVLADSATGAAPTILVSDAAGDPVAGSIVADADGAGFQFVASGGDLAPGTYSAVLRGAIQDEAGRALDGAGDGAPGHDLSSAFTLTAAPAADRSSDPIRLAQAAAL
jgi:hypothetical protein